MPFHGTIWTTLTACFSESFPFCIIVGILALASTPLEFREGVVAQLVVIVFSCGGELSCASTPRDKGQNWRNLLYMLVYVM
jgi:hypothetical protein